MAGFIGVPKINLIRPATLRLAERAPRGGVEILAGVRPEDLAVGAGLPPAGATVGRVYVREPMGAETWVTVETGGERVVGRAPGTSRRGQESRCGCGVIRSG